MKDFFVRKKLDVAISAILCLTIGIVVMIWPTETTRILCWVLAGVLFVMGVGHIASYLIDRSHSQIGLAAGIILVVLGVWIAVRPLNFAKIFPIIIGVVLLMHGLEDLKLAMEIKEHKDSSWCGVLIIALVNFILGVILVWKAMEAVEIAVILVGCALVYDGLTDLFVIYRVNRAIKYAEKYADKTPGVIDVEAEVTSEEEE
ncbi:MAG: DUF308 domain-containing protein [Lachnospiraceae bacterium]|nr:DUF308 domain-containing protein [Lachnospiraceae bacterium]